MSETDKTETRTEWAVRFRSGTVDSGFGSEANCRHVVKNRPGSILLARTVEVGAWSEVPA